MSCAEEASDACLSRPLVRFADHAEQQLRALSVARREVYRGA